MRFSVFLFLSCLSFHAYSVEIESLWLDEAKAILAESPKRALEHLQNNQSKTKALSPADQLHYLEVLTRTYREIGELDKSERFAEQYVQQAKLIQSDYFHPRAIRQQGEIFYQKGSYAKAEERFKSSLAMYVQQDNEPQIAIMQLRVSTAIRSNGRFWEAIELAEAALAYFVAVDDSDRMASAYSSIGLAHEFLGNYSQALDALNKTLAIHIQDNDEIAMADVLYNIASVYVETDDWPAARQYLERALVIDTKAGFKNNVAYDLRRLAQVDLGQQKYEASLRHVIEAKRLFTELGSIRNQAWCLILEGQVYTEVNDLIDAETTLTEGLKYAKKAEDFGLVAAAHTHLASLFVKQNRIDEALVLLKQGLRSAKERDEARNLWLLYSTLVEAYEKSGGYRQALDALKEYVHAEKAREKERRMNTIAQLQNTITSQTQRHEMALIAKDRELTEAKLVQTQFERNVWLAGAGVVLLFLMIFAHKERQKKELAKLKQHLLSEAADRKNKLLADVSHELRTPLTVLGLQIELLEHDLAENPELTYQQLKDKIKELNTLINDVYELSTADSGAMAFHFEESVVTTIFNQCILQIRPLVEQAGLTFSVNSQITAGAIVSVDASRMIQVLSNLVRNSIAYTDKPGEIVINAWLEGKAFHISVEDTAPSVHPDECKLLFDRLYRVEQSRSRDTGGSGLGLAISKRIVEAHNGHISARVSALGGINVELSIPLSQKQQKHIEFDKPVLT
ncbi:tetratricopeptide repeat protein [Alteromonas sp. P256]|uniref:tetratricopeptide repeat protein n=1 Tax=Alteromonas sp. P256 TaxID=3117399 RepID=UPI002FE16CA3